jgi:hypothetical protein
MGRKDKPGQERLKARGAISIENMTYITMPPIWFDEN